MEYESEKEEFRLQSEKMGLARKMRRGICWYPLAVGRSYYNSLNQLVVEVWKKDESRSEQEDAPEQDTEDTAFEYGKPVDLSAIPSRSAISAAVYPLSFVTFFIFSPVLTFPLLYF